MDMTLKQIQSESDCVLLTTKENSDVRCHLINDNIFYLCISRWTEQGYER